jgi:hypothetical protein
MVLERLIMRWYACREWGPRGRRKTHFLGASELTVWTEQTQNQQCGVVGVKFGVRISFANRPLAEQELGALC